MRHFTRAKSRDRSRSLSVSSLSSRTTEGEKRSDCAISPKPNREIDRDPSASHLSPLAQRKEKRGAIAPFRRSQIARSIAISRRLITLLLRTFHARRPFPLGSTANPQIDSNPLSVAWFLLSWSLIRLGPKPCCHLSKSVVG
ncbi:hypothetical protein MRB53_006535 [Persea americana]|uniref:Uncharacterized protein n=1 Tax=Persea americana TaxID=3435 RepID=A0ACC2MGA1_PERAE|nr:hypothetical protein MRB53_006535 [Persea americana]